MLLQVEAGYDNPEKSNLFFKLHQLQTGSWGVSSIGRITQVRGADENTTIYVTTKDCRCVLFEPRDTSFPDKYLANSNVANGVNSATPPM